MGLKPIGSEKLTGQDKINRIMEIATYGEVEKNNDYHTKTVSFSKKASDGNTYAIVMEKDGYYLKRGINESELDYVDGLHNKRRNRFKSYGSALKRMNLIFKPLNEEFNGGEADPMFEQSSKENKFVLKTPESEVDVNTDEELDMDDEELDMGDEELAMDDEELDMDDEELDMDVEGPEEEMEGTMKPIQKLTGKLGQKLRDAAEELGSADIKYVLNSVISAVDLNTLDTEDKDDVLSRFEEDETAYGDEELAMDDMDDMDDIDDMDDMEGEGEEFDMSSMIPESRRKRKNTITEKVGGVAMKSLKNRVSHLLESYVVKKTPQEYIKETISKNKINNTIKKISKTVEQEIRVKKYLNENKYSKLKGITKKGNVVILSDDINVHITREGKVK